MMCWGLSWLLMLTHILLLPPAVGGVGTYYAEPYIGRAMKNGAVYTGQDMTCAVSSALWPEFANKQLLVCTDDSCVIVTVTDTGDAQAFKKHRVVLDLSVAAFDQLADLDDGVLNVRAWIIEEARCNR